MVESVRQFVSLNIFVLLCLLTRNYAARRPIYDFIVGQPPIFPQLREENRNLKQFSNNIFFNYYNKNGTKIYETTVRNVENFAATECHPNEKFAIIVPGWQENCEEKWVGPLILKLNQYRGGCIICMNFGSFAFEPYFRLVRSFYSIVHVLHIHLLELARIGFNLKTGYIFGFSYGGRLACEAGRRLGMQILKDIDVCDMAGPLFDIRPPIDLKLFAQNVQCIHTSRKGTRYSNNCHQNWRMGNCGFSQEAAHTATLGSHGLCPYFYISAFENDFYAVKKPNECTADNPAKQWPEHFKMGYMENRSSEVRGELFAYTGARYPYNVPTNEYMSFNITLEEEYDESFEETTIMGERN